MGTVGTGGWPPQPGFRGTQGAQQHHSLTWESSHMGGWMGEGLAADNARGDPPHLTSPGAEGEAGVGTPGNWLLRGPESSALMIL